MAVANLRALQDVIAKAIDDIERIYDHESKAAGVPLAFPSLEKPYYLAGKHSVAEEKSEKLSEDNRVIAASSLIVAAAGQLTAAVNKPWFSVVDGALAGHFAPTLFYLERANIVEILREAGPGGLHVNEIAKRVDEILRANTKITRAPTNLRYLNHTLRALATFHWINEINPDVYSNNRLSSFIDSGKSTAELKANMGEKYDGTNGLAAYVGGMYDFHDAATAIPEWLLNGGYDKEGKREWKSPFNLHLKTDQVFYERLSPWGASRFAQAMNGTRFWEEIGNMSTGFPWAELPKDAVVIDVGGGMGSASMYLARAFPHLRLVVADREDVVSMAPQVWGPAYAEYIDTGRVTFHVHDMFEPQVAVYIKGLGNNTTPAHVYILRCICHDWKDPEVKRLLSALRKSAGPHTRLLIVDIVLAHACQDNEALETSSGVDHPSTRSLAPAGSPLLPNLGKASAHGHLLDLYSVDKILARFLDVGFQDFEVVWLLSAHTTAAANDVDPTVPGSPFDSTPNLFDTQFFIETQLEGVAFTGRNGVQGEVTTPLRGEFRLQSDFLIARDSRTACEWQSFTNDQGKFVETFPDVMRRLSLLGQDETKMIDCTEVIPEPKTLTPRPHLPAGKSMKNIEAACAETPFPTLPTDPGPATAVRPVPKPNVRK